MNSKSKTSSCQKSGSKSKSILPVMKLAKITAKVLMILFIIIGFAGIGVLSGILYAYISAAVPISEEDLNLSENLTTVIYDETGQKEIARLTGFDNTDRVLVFDRDGQIPQYLKYAFVAIEDERFYRHRGVDLKRTLGAVLNFTFYKCSSGKSVERLPWPRSIL